MGALYKELWFNPSRNTTTLWHYKSWQFKLSNEHEFPAKNIIQGRKGGPRHRSCASGSHDTPGASALCEVGKSQHAALRPRVPCGTGRAPIYHSSPPENPVSRSSPLNLHHTNLYLSQDTHSLTSLLWSRWNAVFRKQTKTQAFTTSSPSAREMLKEWLHSREKTQDERGEMTSEWWAVTEGNKEKVTT